jgi:enamine deaminase RidA (YjgF/YER057c/UK114 family)
MTQYKVAAGRPWAQTVGYSRAVRRGRLIEVSGTSATTPDGKVVAPGDVYRQTQHILGEVLSAIAELGGQPGDVVRTRVYLTDISRWEEAGRAHGEVFAGIDPACTFVEITNLMLPELVVEVEATALLAEQDETQR